MIDSKSPCKMHILCLMNQVWLSSKFSSKPTGSKPTTRIEFIPWHCVKIEKKIDDHVINTKLKKRVWSYTYAYVLYRQAKSVSRVVEILSGEHLKESTVFSGVYHRCRNVVRNSWMPIFELEDLARIDPIFSQFYTIYSFK